MKGKFNRSRFGGVPERQIADRCGETNRDSRNRLWTLDKLYHRKFQMGEKNMDRGVGIGFP